MINKSGQYDVVIIGGGFYGSMLALYLRKYFKRIVILEKEKALLQKASYKNQARVHNGYHYPRNFITALRSHMNYERFTKEFKDATETHHTMIYAIARGTSKSTSTQFIRLCNQIGSPLKPVPSRLKKLFSDFFIEDLFMVDEVVFNSVKIRKQLTRALEKKKVQILYQTEVAKVTENNDKGVVVHLKDGETLSASNAINCTYADINVVLRNSNLPLLPLKYELAEMPLVQMPDVLKDVGITIMDGPFFSLMPFPDKKMHSFHHVRYTPHTSWTDSSEAHLKKRNSSHYLYMKKHASRYIPLLDELKYKNSLYEIKTVLMQNEDNDGRPILFRKDYGIKNFHVVMGGKLDNIYDIFNKINQSGFVSYDLGL